MVLWLLSTCWYAGLAAAAVGAVGVLKPLTRLRIRTRSRALVLMTAGAALAFATIFAGTSVKRVRAPVSLLDEVFPAFQFDETHAIEIAAPPDTVYRALREVTADEIAFFRTLTWIRCLGRCAGESIMNPRAGTPILETAVRTGFRVIAERPGIEIVLATFVAAPPDASRREWTRDAFIALDEPGFAKAALNFRLEPLGADRTMLRTSTRVFATDSRTLRAFTVYWRTIAPGSAIIRGSWLKAVKRRAEKFQDSRVSFLRNSGDDLACLVEELDARVA